MMKSARMIELPLRTAGCRSFRYGPSLSALNEQKPMENGNPLLHHTKIPGFRKFPIVGSVPAVVLNKHFDRHKVHLFWRAAFDRFGPIISLQNPGNPPLVVILKPDDIEATCRATLNNPIRYGLSSLRKVRREARDNFYEGKTGILTENHEEWKRVRSKVNHSVMDIKKIRTYLHRMDEVALDFVDRIGEFQKLHGQMPDDFLEEIYKWALESVGTIALNCRFGCLEADLPPDSLPMRLIIAVNEVFAMLPYTELGAKFWKFFPTPNIRKLQRIHDHFNEMVDEVERFAEQMARNSPDGGGLLEELRNIPNISRKDVTTFLVDMFAGGIDTTSHTVGFTLYLLAKNPSVQRKLQEEVDNVLGDGKEALTASNLSKLVYLRNCVKESLRVFPIVVGSPRVLTGDLALSGYLVPKGHGVFCVNMVTSLHEDFFSRPTEFIPERWQRDRPLGPIHPFAFLPFAHGTRVCIGRRIAEQELHTLIARIMHRFHVEYHYEDIEIRTRFVCTPSRPLKLSFSERSK